MKKLIVLFCLFLTEINAIPPAVAGGVMAISAATSLHTLTEKKSSLFGGLFASNNGISLEEIMFSVEEDMNDRGAVKVHVVIVYNKELAEELSKMSANHYFQCIDQLIKDHPDRIKIFEWELVAKKRIFPWKEIKYPRDHMDPLYGFIFAKYSGSGEYRAKIPPSYKKVKVTFEKKNFRIDHEDKDE